MFREAIEVEVPVRVAYDQWTQFERFPTVMGGLDSVRQIDAKTLAWRARVGGRPLEWTAEIVEQDPDRMISWRSTSGVRNVGTVRFEPVGDRACRVILEMEVEPEGLLQVLGGAMGLLQHRVRDALQHFRAFLEQRGRATGSWRGVIHGDVIVGPAPRSMAGPPLGADSAPRGILM